MHVSVYAVYPCVCVVYVCLCVFNNELRKDGSDMRLSHLFLSLFLSFYLSICLIRKREREREIHMNIMLIPIVDHNTIDAKQNGVFVYLLIIKKIKEMNFDFYFCL